jgi:hypothetical protein
MPFTATSRSVYRRVGDRFAIALFLLGMVLLGHPAQAGDRVTVVELFTSQGCPSCPGADKLLGKLAERDDILALSFHVKYWDYIGWADPFANDLYSQRQQRYLDQIGLPYVYTPQMVVDGKRHASGNKPQEVAMNIRNAQAVVQGRVSIGLDRISDSQVRIQIPGVDARYRGEAEIVIVRFDDKLVTEVMRGENKGKTLVNFHVVRLMRPVARWNGETVDVVVSLQDLEGGNPAYYAIFVQERGQGRILGASVVDMRALAPRG